MDILDELKMLADHIDDEIARKFKRGMVVDVLEDGADVGKDVAASPWWRVVDAPGPASDYSYLLGSDPEFADLRQFANRNPFPRKRVNVVDLDALEASVGLSAGAQPEATVQVTKEAALAQVSQDAAVANPLVIGESPPIEVIG